jgi:uncharacterized protein YndB with AHSA1/START domain
MSKKNKPNELYITRIYDAPVKMVWDAWVDPKQVAKWWGPRGFTLTTVSKDVKPGGRWIYTMHGPDGTDYPNNTLFHEVEKYSKLVYDHGANDHQPPLFKVTVLFSETNGKTKMDMTMALATPEAAQEIKKFIKQAGGDSTWDRLAEFLSPVDRFVINRSFEAPINVVYYAWTNPEHLQKWVPPTDFTMKYINPDVRVGGSAFYSMSNAEGLTMFGKANYIEMTKPHRIVYTQIFCDKDEKISRHPMAPTWPETMLTTVTLSEESENQTRVTITWEVYGEATDVERETFHSAKAGMTQGWSGSFEKLEQYLKT